jgi:hypothetical protein
MSGTVCAVMLVKDEADIVETTIRHLLWHVDEVIVADNLSSDGTREILERLPVELRDDPEIGYYQDRKTTALAMEALARGHRWVLPCDADEIWHHGDCDLPIRDYLGGLGPDVGILRALVFNHFATDVDEPAANPVAQLCWRQKKHGMVKVACRLRPDLSIEMGNHGAQTTGGTLTIDAPLNVRHFSWRSEAQFCNPPEAPIWMGDLTFRHLGDVRVGDEVIGWGHSSARTKIHLLPSAVTDVSVRQSPIVRVEFESGRSLRCSPDHLWRQHFYGTRGPDRFPIAVGGEQGRGQGIGRWGQGNEVIVGDATYVRGSGVFKTAAIGRSLTHVITPSFPSPDYDDAWLAGWLAGMFDGEGHRNHIAQSAAANPFLYEELCEALDHFGFPYRKAEMGVHLVGGRETFVRFANLVRPKKRSTWADQMLASRGIGGTIGHPDKIVAVEEDGESEVISLTTATGNYVAWGYASKNCRKITNGRAAYAATNLPAMYGAGWRVYDGAPEEAIRASYHEHFVRRDPAADAELIYDPAPVRGGLKGGTRWVTTSSR